MAATQAAQAIKEISDDLVVSTESETYNEITESYFSELERELEPEYFVLPQSAQQVSQVLKACRPFAGDLRIAICGAGQQCTPGVANVRDGLTIHLRNLKGVQVDEGTKIVSVAAGEKMGSVYEKLVGLGLGVAGNRHSSGGIGGDALQGKFTERVRFLHVNICRWLVILLLFSRVHLRRRRKLRGCPRERRDRQRQCTE